MSSSEGSTGSSTTSGDMAESFRLAAMLEWDGVVNAVNHDSFSKHANCSTRALATCAVVIATRKMESLAICHIYGRF